MDNKEFWPEWKKQQFNSQIRKKRERNRLKDDRLHPEIWKRELNENSLFSMLAHMVPINSTIKKVLVRYYPRVESKGLLLSAIYLKATYDIFPAYYSDRERLIVMLNRARHLDDLDQLVEWSDYHNNEFGGHYLHLMIGIYYLDRFVNDLSSKYCLKMALHNLLMAKKDFKTQEAHLAFNGLLALAHYLNQDFEESSNVVKLNLSSDHEFQERFLKLIEKEAA